MAAPAPGTSSDDFWRPLRCTVRPHREELWVSLEGEFDLASADAMSARLDEYLGSGFARIVLDLGGLTFMDSSGLRTIISARHSADARGVDFAVAPGPPAVQRIFQITGTTELLAAPRPGA